MTPRELTAVDARYFGRHRMTEHAQLLRAFRRAQALGLPSGWDAAFVAEWLRLAGIAGEPYPVLARGEACACGASAAWQYTMIRLPDGALVRCQDCGRYARVGE